jgi:glutamate-1-semialdehyde 2,1-aminomutase
MSSPWPDQSPKSAALFERGKAVIAGGNTRHSLYYPPFPPFAASGDGAWVIDVDGVRRLDCVNSNTVGILGHSPAPVAAALHAQVDRMISVGMPTAGEIELAELITERAPSVEQVRFTNSGTEALMFAVRAARAYTGRTKVAKLEGAYNGSYDHLFFSIRPLPDAWGSYEKPTPVMNSAGISPAVLDELIVLHANDLENAETQLRAQAEQVACVVIDPLVAFMSFLPLTRDYLAGLRALTRELGIVLIFDEVLTFRIGYGGAQADLGVHADLTTLGKIVGGGLPIGVVGGSRDLMSVFDHAKGPPKVELSGTFGGNPMTMAAGAASLRALTPQSFAYLDDLAARLRSGLRAIVSERSIPARITGEGSLVGIVLTEAVYANYRDYYAEMVRNGGWEFAADFHRRMLNHGVFAGRNAGFNLSTAMTEADIDFLLEACRTVLTEMFK